MEKEDGGKEDEFIFLSTIFFSKDLRYGFAVFDFRVLCRTAVRFRPRHYGRAKVGRGYFFGLDGPGGAVYLRMDVVGSGCARGTLGGASASRSDRSP